MTGAGLTIAVGTADAEALRLAVDRGEYPSIDAALSDAIATWSRRHEDREDDLAWIRAKIRASIADPDPDLSDAEVDERLTRTFGPERRESDEAA